ncbi:hypothetical protein CBS9595_000308 [Malassezia furfur]|nr:hypothetical protein CBS9595_000308 [Malassezia furfur]
MTSSMMLLRPAGQGLGRLRLPWALLGISHVLISSVLGAHDAHDHQLASHRTHHGAALADRSTTTRSSTKKQATKNSGVMSTSNKLFPLVIVAIIVGCIVGLVLLVLAARCFLRRKAGQDEPEADFPEKRVATLRHATSNDSNATLYDDDAELKKPPAPLARPIMSSVSRGTLGRFGSVNSAASHNLLDLERGPDVPEKCARSHDAREKVLQSRASVRSDNSGTTLYSLYSQVGKEEAAGVRENDLATPCLTHATAGWEIRPSAHDGVEDVSLDGPPRTTHAP